MGVNDTLEQLRAAQAYAVELEEKNAALAAVIEQAKATIGDVNEQWKPLVLADILASADTDAALRERDRATAERAWNESYVTQFEGAPFEMSDTTGITDPSNPYRAEVAS